MLYDADFLRLECVYGDKIHADPLKAHRESHQAVLNTVARHGKIITPTFAVGRSQELV